MAPCYLPRFRSSLAEPAGGSDVTGDANVPDAPRNSCMKCRKCVWDVIENNSSGIVTTVSIGQNVTSVQVQQTETPAPFTNWPKANFHIFDTLNETFMRLFIAGVRVCVVPGDFPVLLHAAVEPVFPECASLLLAAVRARGLPPIRRLPGQAKILLPTNQHRRLHRRRDLRRAVLLLAGKSKSGPRAFAEKARSGFGFAGSACFLLFQA